MRIEVVNPDIKNFVKSIRDIGYTFEVAIADIIDNSISANANLIKIYALPKPEIHVSIFDNGYGMTEDELTEAMRLASSNIKIKTNNKELGKFGLGLKTASFSQCRKLTVISKKNGITSIKQWDLDYISDNNQWLLITPDINDFSDNFFYEKLENSKSGTIVIWEKIDRYKQKTFSLIITTLRNHLSLVFHQFLEDNLNKIKIFINNNEINPFNPFNPNHNATYEKSSELIKIFNKDIKITPYILPHHSKVSKQEWEYYATKEGYTKSQGFYLYRAKRLLIYGTWWGLHRASDASKLVRIKIDISNDQDELWGIDVKKSKANPIPELKKDLKRIINESIKDGVKPYIKRGNKINDKTLIKFWEIVPIDNKFRFSLNRNHPILKKLETQIDEEALFFLDKYLKGVEAYLPLETIELKLQQNTHEVDQKSALTTNDIAELITRLKNIGLDDDYIRELLKTEMKIIINKEELL